MARIVLTNEEPGCTTSLPSFSASRASPSPPASKLGSLFAQRMIRLTDKNRVGAIYPIDGRPARFAVRFLLRAQFSDAKEMTTLSASRSLSERALGRRSAFQTVVKTSPGSGFVVNRTGVLFNGLLAQYRNRSLRLALFDAASVLRHGSDNHSHVNGIGPESAQSSRISNIRYPTIFENVPALQTVGRTSTGTNIDPALIRVWSPHFATIATFIKLRCGHNYDYLRANNLKFDHWSHPFQICKDTYTRQ